MRSRVTLIDTRLQRLYHATNREDAEAIVREGFMGGWGDVGYGVYFYDTRAEADAYAAKGGWDRSLHDPVILEVKTTEAHRVPVLSHEWDESTYENMWWVDLSDHEDDDDYRWHPESVRIL